MKLRTYTLKETSKIINVPTSTIKQWEKGLNGLLIIPRSKQGARIYSDIEIDLLLEIKQWEANKLGKAEIRERLQQLQDFSESGDFEIENYDFEIENYDSEIVSDDSEIENNDSEIVSDDPEIENNDSEIENNDSEIVSDDPEIENNDSEIVSDDSETSLSSISNKEELSEVPTELSMWNQEQFFIAMDQYKKNFLNEVKDEIRNVVRTEVVEEVKKEISKGNFYTVKSLSDSLYKTSANMQDDLKELSFTVQKTADLTDKTINRLGKTISSQSLESAEEFYSISKQLAETSEELAHYIDVTNKEIGTLTEAVETQHEYFMEDREQFRHEVRQREIAFQGMLSNYREAAAAKEKKWWKFW
jgi:DNA-binding transcriptional MerR regulator